MSAAPTGDNPLTPYDAVNVLEEILEAKNQSRFLGLKLNVPEYIVSDIHTQYTDPKERLYYVLVEFLKQVDPRPTWRAIVAALRSSAVNLPQLAMRVEAAHFPDSTASRDPPPPEATTSIATRSAVAITETSSSLSSGERDTGSSAAVTEEAAHLPDLTTTGDPPPEATTSTGQMTVQYVQVKIRQFQKRFNYLKKSTREYLERLKIPVKRVADVLTSLPADDYFEEQMHFLTDNLSALFQAPDHSELFGIMNFHWNYQNPQLLDHLIQEFSLEGIKGEMMTYKEDLRQFMQETPLKLFCQSQKKKRIKPPPPDFREVVVEFDWPDYLTLEVVEEFRQEYANHYSLQECAMMLNKVLPS